MQKYFFFNLKLNQMNKICIKNRKKIGTKFEVLVYKLPHRCSV